MFVFLLKKRAEVDEWKRRRALLQRAEDMEYRILNDHYKTEKLTDSLRKQDHIYNEVIREVRDIQLRGRRITSLITSDNKYNKNRSDVFLYFEIYDLCYLNIIF